jgi:hypothetical protein
VYVGWYDDRNDPASTLVPPDWQLQPPEDVLHRALQRILLHRPQQRLSLAIGELEHHRDFPRRPNPKLRLRRIGLIQRHDVRIAWRRNGR